MAKINFEDYFMVKWKPKKYRYLAGDNTGLIRSLVSKDKIWFVVSDLDRLRGLKSSASNTTWRIRQNREAENIHYISVSKKDFFGTNLIGVVTSRTSTLVDEYLAKRIISESSLPAAESAYKKFINGSLQKSKLKQAKLRMN